MWGYDPRVTADSDGLLLANPTAKATLFNDSDSALLYLNELTVGMVLSILILERVAMNTL